MKYFIALVAGVEVAFGFTLLVVPWLAVRLLFGVEIADAAVVISRIAGISLIALGVACWPGRETATHAIRGLLSYNLLVTVFLATLGAGGEWAGTLLWPAVVFHFLATIILGRAWFVTG